MADSLTDQQLVQELQSFGENVSLPIKAIRRPILIKKLNHLKSRTRPPLQKGKQTIQRPSLKLDVLSSDDSEEDQEPTTSTPSQSFNYGARDHSASSKITEVVKRSLRRKPIVSPVNAVGSSVRSRRILTTESKSRTREQSSQAEESLTSTDIVSPNSRSRSNLYPDLSALRDKDASISSHDIRDTTFESSDSDMDGTSYEVENKSVNTTFSLGRGRRTPTSNHVTPQKNFTPQSPSKPSQYSSNSVPDQNSVSSRNNLAFRGHRRRRFYPEHVPFGLVGLALAFFVIITLSYMFVRKDFFIGWITGDPSSKVPIDNQLLCTHSEGREESCCTREEAIESLKVINDLYLNLSSKLGDVLCGIAAEPERLLKVTDFKKSFRYSHLPKHLVDNNRLYNCCLNLIIANPHWNIKVLNSNLENVQDISEVHFLESSVPSMGIFCRILRSFSRVMWSLFVLVGGVTILGLILIILWWRIKEKELEEQEVFSMVEQIIDLLKEQHEFAQKDGNQEVASGLAVQHVRDQLLPPAKRKAQQHIWDKAVKFIEANESRVRLETQVIEGEEFAVWRWIQIVPNGGKVWQGQAFGEHNENNLSTSVYSPTPCLKIRNMFDKEVENDEQWEESVKDALLEKCRDIKSLVHVYVDKSSREGCVYVKCNSREAAGQVRQALHGWWFDGRLVTVKLLKEEHYYGRWPEAKFAWRPLQPSTNQMRSLAQPYHRSSLEMT